LHQSISMVLRLVKLLLLAIAHSLRSLVVKDRGINSPVFLLLIQIYGIRI
jgi:hypothetical protein